MAITGNDTDGYVALASAISAASLATPSFHFLYRNAASPDVAGVGVANTAYSVSNSGENYGFGFYYHADLNTTRQSVYHFNSGGTRVLATLVTVPSPDTWYGIGGSYDGANVKAYLDGALEATTAATAFSTSSSHNPTPAALAATAGSSGFDDGTICEVALWNVALTADEFAALGKKVSPLLIRPTALVHYWPLIREITPMFGPATTSGGTFTVATHAPVIHAAAPVTIRNHGVAATEWQPVDAAWSSGLEMDENASPVFSASASAAMKLTSAMAGEASSLVGETTSRLTLRSRFTSRSGTLASGRRKERF
jgi:hypothetical protein